MWCTVHTNAFSTIFVWLRLFLPKSYIFTLLTFQQDSTESNGKFLSPDQISAILKLYKMHRCAVIGTRSNTSYFLSFVVVQRKLSYLSDVRPQCKKKITQCVTIYHKKIFKTCTQLQFVSSRLKHITSCVFLVLAYFSNLVLFIDVDFQSQLEFFQCYSTSCYRTLRLVLIYEFDWLT